MEYGAIILLLLKIGSMLLPVFLSIRAEHNTPEYKDTKEKEKLDNAIATHNETVVTLELNAMLNKLRH